MTGLILRGALWSLLTGGGVVMGVTGAAVGTDAGRAALIEYGLGVANEGLRGTVTIGSSEGRPLRGLTLYDVAVADTGGRPVVTADAINVRYRVRDLLSGRIVLGQLTLTQPVVHLARTPDGRWNIQEVLKLGEGDGSGSSLLVAFRDVRLDSATITITEASTRTITVVAARLPYLRLNSPLPGQGAVRIEVADVGARLSEPELGVTDAEGSVELHGDSLVFDLASLELAGTSMSLRGWLHLGDTVRFDLRANADQFAAADFAAFTASLPAGLRSAEGRARVRMVRRAPQTLTVELDQLDATPGDGGSVTGRISVSLAPDARWALADTDLRTDAVSLDLLHALVDSVPLQGRLSGRMRAAGPGESLAVQVDWRFVDAAVDGRPVSTVVAEGALRFGGDDGVRFLDVGVTRSSIALATIEQQVPAVALHGTLDAAGTLTGPFRDVTFSGTMRHRDQTHHATLARGVVRLDTRGDTAAVALDLAFDSLAIDGLLPSYPGLPLVGSFAGDVRATGPVTSLDVGVDLRGPGGAFRGEARVVSETLRRIEALDLTFEGATLVVLEERLPDTRLTGRVAGAVAFDSAVRFVDLGVRLDRSTVAAVPLDSMVATLRTANDRVQVEALTVWAAQLSATGRGALGLTAGRRDTARLDVAVGDVEELRPLLDRLAGPDAESWLPDTVTGSLNLTVAAIGALDQMDLRVTATVADLRWGQYQVPSGTASLALTDDTTIGVTVRVDSLVIGSRGFSGIRLVTDGDRQRQRFTLRGRLGEHAAVLVGGFVDRDTVQTAVRLDSVAMLAGDVVWFLERSGTVTLADSAVRFDSLSFAPTSGASRISIAGTLPRLGRGAVAVRIEALQLEELWAALQRDPDLVRGELSGSLTLSGTARAPVMEAAIALRDAVFGEFHAPYAETNATYADQSLSATIRLFRLGDEILGVEVVLPLELALMDVERRRLDGPISIRAVASEVDLALLDALSPAVRRTAGQFSADFGVTGTWERPALTGFISVTDGAASFPALGVRHERMNGRVVLAGDSLRVERLSVASGGGTATVTGSIRLEQLTAAHLNLGIRSTDFRAIDVPEFVTATVSGDVQLRGPVTGAVLTGRGTVTRGVVWFADIVEKDIINLEDTAYAGLVDRALLLEEGLGAGFENRFLDSLTITNLALTMGSDVWLRSNEANIALTGDVTLAKTGQNYRLDGMLSAPRGTYRLQLIPLVEGFEREFTVTRGQVQYFGTTDLDASLDIDARHVVRARRGDNVTIFVHVGGTIYNPTLTLSSDHRPALSDTEIISYLLSGAPSVGSEGLGQQGLQQGLGVAEAIAGRITGRIVGGVITDLGVPIDYFEFRPQFAGGSVTGTVSVGRRITDRVFVTVNPRICGRDQWELYNLGFGLEYRLSRAWRLAMAADPLGSCSLLGADPSTLRYQLGLDLWWETTY